ncbi:MAG: hypothetical protein K1X86_15635 [Ignavibacteria bacterium]|nr:hypothetical protein [Ignavibacteria bacterium]
MNNLYHNIHQVIKTNSGFDSHRNYIGLSGIADCPVEITRRYFSGSTPTLNDHLNAYRGYFLEKEIKKILECAGIRKPNSDRELTAPFDNRIKGHTDGETLDGKLLEIKTWRKDKFDRVKQEGKVPYKIFAQCNGYMGFGGYKETLLVIVSTETFEFHLHELKFSSREFTKQEEKLKQLLWYLDNETVPVCTCGKCKIAVEAKAI